MPVSDQPSVANEFRLLQQFRDLLRRDTDTQLSPEEMREMEETFNQWREESGMEEIPDLDSIPPDWIQQTLQNPVVRTQVQQLLERYARDKQLPRATPGENRESLRIPSDTSRNPTVNRRRNDNLDRPNSERPNDRPDTQPNVERPSAERPNLERPNRGRTNVERDNSGRPEGPDPDSPRSLSPNSDTPRPGNRQPRRPERSRLVPPPNGRRANDRAPGVDPETTGQDRTTPGQLPAEKVPVLQGLFEQLMKNPAVADGARQWLESLNDAAGDPTDEENLLDRSTESPAERQRPTASAAEDQPEFGIDSAPRRPRESRNLRTPNARAAGRSPNRPRTGAEANSGRTPPRNASPRRPEDRPSTDSQPPESRTTSQDPRSNAVRQTPRDTGPERSGSNNNTRPRSTNQAGPNSNAARTRPAAERVGQGTSGARSGGDDRLDLKSQISQLNRTLRGIVNRKLREHRESRGEGDESDDTEAAPSWWAKSERKSEQKPAPTSKQSDPERRASGAANRGSAERQAQTQSRRNNSEYRRSMARSMRKFGNDVWKSIATAPSATSASRSKNRSDGPSPTLQWHPTQWWLLIVAAGLVLVLVLLRKRVATATQQRELVAKLTKQLLTSGIRSRADLIRAFHLVVLGSPHPAADWWTHRRAATKLAEAAPQLHTFLDELARLYELARYLPPDAELSEDQLARATDALQQCQPSP